MADDVTGQPVQAKDDIAQRDEDRTDANDFSLGVQQQDENSDHQKSPPPHAAHNKAKQKRGFLVIDLIGTVVALIVVTFYLLPDDQTEQKPVPAPEPEIATHNMSVSQAEKPEYETVIVEGQSPATSEVEALSTAATTSDETVVEKASLYPEAEEQIPADIVSGAKEKPQTPTTEGNNLTVAESDEIVVPTETQPYASIDTLEPAREDITVAEPTSSTLAMKPLLAEPEPESDHIPPSTAGNPVASPDKTQILPAKPARLWALNLLSTPSQSKAERINKQLQVAGTESQITAISVGERTYYRIRVLNYATKQQASHAMDSFRANVDYKHAWVSSYSNHR